VASQTLSPTPRRLVRKDWWPANEGGRGPRERGRRSASARGLYPVHARDEVVRGWSDVCRDDSLSLSLSTRSSDAPQHPRKLLAEPRSTVNGTREKFFATCSALVRPRDVCRVMGIQGAGVSAPRREGERGRVVAGATTLHENDTMCSRRRFQLSRMHAITPQFVDPRDRASPPCSHVHWTAQCGLAAADTPLPAL
jgi:hypothetical protein